MPASSTASRSRARGATISSARSITRPRARSSTSFRRAYPAHAILGEETGRHGEGEFLWIIDRLDGTTNYLHGYAQYAVSIGLYHQGKPFQAVVFDPLKNELYTASRGAGAQLNDRRMRVSGVSHLQPALLGTGFPFKSMENLDVWINTFRSLVPQVSGVSRAGSDAVINTEVIDIQRVVQLALALASRWGWPVG